MWVLVSMYNSEDADEKGYSLLIIYLSKICHRCWYRKFRDFWIGPSQVGGRKRWSSCSLQVSYRYSRKKRYILKTTQELISSVSIVVSGQKKMWCSEPLSCVSGREMRILPTAVIQKECEFFFFVQKGSWKRLHSSNKDSFKCGYRPTLQND